MAQSDLLNLTIAQAAPKLERGELSPVDLTDAMLQRVGAVNKQLCAYITVCDQQARDAAQAVERLIRAGYYLGPLHGIPIALKDNIYTRGIRTTAGAKILSDFVPDEEPTVTAAWGPAAPITVGKTNMHESAWAGTTDNPHSGPCPNPWNPDRFPAGSSGAPGRRWPRARVSRR